MAGNESVEKVAAYLSRLTGETVPTDQPIQLRSVHRAALRSWARREGVALKLSALGGGGAFTVTELLDGPVERAVTQPAPNASPAEVLPSTAAMGGIGIDIEDVENLPDAFDYREHAFFQDNFTSAEIAYCLRQKHVKASFCGTWAAKEAVLKAGITDAPGGHLKHIEIARDRVDRPIYPGCSLSISHTPRTAVAVCVALGVRAVSAPVAPPSSHAAGETMQAGAAESKRGRWPWSR